MPLCLEVKNVRNNAITRVCFISLEFSLGNMMKTISNNAGLKPTYTKHCIRAMAVTTLLDAGVAVQDIMAVTGHRSANSISHYSKTSEVQRLVMSNIIFGQLGLGVSVATMVKDTVTDVRVTVTPEKKNMTQRKKTSATSVHVTVTSQKMGEQPKSVELL